jgi:hypothetical protein
LLVLFIKDNSNNTTMDFLLPGVVAEKAPLLIDPLLMKHLNAKSKSVGSTPSITPISTPNPTFRSINRSRLFWNDPEMYIKGKPRDDSVARRRPRYTPLSVLTNVDILGNNKNLPKPPSKRLYKSADAVLMRKISPGRDAPRKLDENIKLPAIHNNFMKETDDEINRTIVRNTKGRHKRSGFLFY